MARDNIPPKIVLTIFALPENLRSLLRTACVSTLLVNSIPHLQGNWKRFLVGRAQETIESI
jgi:hypothetical protein